MHLGEPRPRIERCYLLDSTTGKWSKVWDRLSGILATSEIRITNFVIAVFVFRMRYYEVVDRSLRRMCLAAVNSTIFQTRWPESLILQ